MLQNGVNYISETYYLIVVHHNAYTSMFISFIRNEVLLQCWYTYRSSISYSFLA